jgi:hypothetical protein
MKQILVGYPVLRTHFKLSIRKVSPIVAVSL